jgi:hypothetical protein
MDGPFEPDPDHTGVGIGLDIFVPSLHLPGLFNQFVMETLRVKQELFFLAAGNDCLGATERGCRGTG